MIDEDALRVWCGSRLVGHLWRDAQDRLGFQYEADWLNEGFRLSTQLHLTPEPFIPEGERAHHFPKLTHKAKKTSVFPWFSCSPASTLAGLHK